MHACVCVCVSNTVIMKPIECYVKKRKLQDEDYKNKALCIKVAIKKIDFFPPTMVCGQNAGIVKTTANSKPKQEKKKPHINIVVTGHRGKSTTTSHLIYKWRGTDK